jgi:hypothetical protein
MVTEGTTPLPDSETCCGLSAALSKICNVAVAVPADPGLNVAVTVQLLFGGTLCLAQLKLALNDDALGPTTDALVTSRFPGPLLAALTVMSLAVWTPTSPKAREDALNPTDGLIPLPLRAIVCGLSEALS